MYSRKNILYIAPSPSVKGGISTVIKGYLSSDLPKIHNIFLSSSHVDGTKFIKLIQAVLGLVKTLVYLIYKGIDIVHIHGGDITSFKRKFYYIKLIRFFKSKIIYHHHGAAFMEEYNVASRRWKNRIKRTLEEIDLVICLSESWRNNILKVAPAATIKVIPNGINIINFPGKKISNGMNLTFLGLIGERKGIFDLLKVVKRLIDDGIEAKLRIGGNGEIDRLREEITDLDLSDNVNFLGWISKDQKDFLLKETDIFLLPSYGEGMPMSIIEAMSYSIPVISTSVGGVPELVSDGETGFLINPGDLGALYEKIKFLIQNKKYRKKFGKQGKQIIQNKHNTDAIIKKMLDIYDSL